VGSSTDPLKVEELLSNVVADISRPIGCVVAFVVDQDPPSGSLRLLHSFQSFPGVPGQSRERMQVLCTEGGVEGVDMAAVGFNANQLGITADIVVPGSAERMLQLLNDEPGHELVGPYESTNTNICTTKARSMDYLPYPLLGGMFGSNLTARQAYELLVPELIDGGLMTICAPLVEFLTVALVRPSEHRSTPLTVYQHLVKLGYVPGTAAISYRSEHILYRDLPGLRPARVGTLSDPALLDVARGVREMAAEARAYRYDRADSRAQARIPQSVRDRIGETIVDRLLLLYRAEDDADLPSIYHEWAARPRGVSARWVLQQAVDAACATLGAPGFEVTPTQVMAFKNFSFAGLPILTLGLDSYPSVSPRKMPSPPKLDPCWQRTGSVQTPSISAEIRERGHCPRRSQ
jgi:hypothetical protein